MMLFLVGVVLVLGTLSDGSHSLAAAADLVGLPKDGPASAALVKPSLDPCRIFREGGLKDIPTASDVKGSAANDTIKTVETTVISNTDEAGQATGDKTVVEKTTETDVKPGGNVSKTTETQVVVDEEGKISGEKNVTESETVTETTPEDGTLTQTTVKKVTDDEGNEVGEEVVIKKKATASSFTSATEEKPKTEPTFSASGKSDGPQKVNRTETTTKISRGNDTNEVLVTKEEQSVSSHGSVKVKESKNVTAKADGKDVEKETVIQKEVEKNVCNGDAKEVHDAKRLNETVEDLKHQVIDVKHKVKEEKAKAEEASFAASKFTVLKATGTQKGMVVKTVVPSTRPGKVVAQVVPSVKVVRKVVPVVKYVTKSIPVVVQKRVLVKVRPAVTERRPSVVTERKVIEKVVPSATEGKVQLVTPTEKVAEQAAPVGEAEIVAIPEGQEQGPVVTEAKVPVVTKRVVEKVTPTAAGEKTVTQRTLVEQTAAPAEEKVVSITKAEEE